jgi:hypothetical protein
MNKALRLPDPLRHREAKRGNLQFPRFDSPLIGG